MMRKPQPIYHMSFHYRPRDKGDFPVEASWTGKHTVDELKKIAIDWALDDFADNTATSVRVIVVDGLTGEQVLRFAMSRPQSVPLT